VTPIRCVTTMKSAGYDDYEDLALKFNATDLAMELISAEKEPGDIVPLVIKADYNDSDEFEPLTLQGQDCIVIVNE
jgi:hypothetical protein